MELVFHNPHSSADPASRIPVEGEVHFRPSRPEDSGRVELASLVLEKGPAALAGGAGQPRRLAISAAPTLDDLLAASLVRAIAEGRAVPAGMKAFARYVGLVREGFRPCQLPLEQSVAGVFQTLCADAGGSLTEPATAARFLEGWGRLERAIWAAAEAGVDPFTTPFLAGNEDFAREWAFLEQDREVYRQDAARGRRLRVRLADGPPRAAALILKQPRSALFKYWSRCDADAPGGGYLLLGVNRGDGHWVFSTDPARRISLLGLCQRLQRAEHKAAGDADLHSWFDGARFHHSLIAAPRRGSRLADKKVMRQVCRWAGVRPALRDLPVKSLSAGLVAALILLAVGSGMFRRSSPSVADSRGGHLQPPDPSDGWTESEGRRGRDRAILFAGNHYGPGWEKLNNPVGDAEALRQTLENRFGFSPCEAVKDPDENTVYEKLMALRNEHFVADDQLLIFFAGHGSFRAAFGSGYLIVKDSVEPTSIAPTHCIAYDALKNLIDGIPCPHILVVLDVCYGGTFGDALPPARGAADPTEDRERVLRRVLGRNVPKTRLYVSSVGANLASDGEGGGHSPFARYLLEALDAGGTAHGGVLLLSEVYAHVSAGLVDDPGPQRDRSGPQLGSFSPGSKPGNSPGGEFVFVRR